MTNFYTRRQKWPAVRFDRYVKPWPHNVETILGDVGVPHPVVVTVQGNIPVNTGDWIVYTPVGPQVFKNDLFNYLFRAEGEDITEADEEALAAIEAEKERDRGA